MRTDGEVCFATRQLGYVQEGNTCLPVLSRALAGRKSVAGSGWGPLVGGPVGREVGRTLKGSDSSYRPLEVDVVLRLIAAVVGASLRSCSLIEGPLRLDGLPIELVGRAEPESTERVEVRSRQVRFAVGD